MSNSVTTSTRPRSKTPLVVGGGAAATVAIAACINLFSASNAELAASEKAEAARHADLSERVAVVELETKALEGLPETVSEIKVDVAKITTNVAWIREALE